MTPPSDGLANSRKPILKTYSRAGAKRSVLNDDTVSIKRRRVAAVDAPHDTSSSHLASTQVPSSPPSEPPVAIFSDENVPDLSPCSSPPLLPQNCEVGTTRTSMIQTDLGVSKQPRCRVASKPKQKTLVQLRLNLGQPSQKRCRTCGMEYTPSNTEDVALHKKFHAKGVDGVSLNKEFLKRAECWQGIEWQGKDGEDRIVSVTRRAQCQPGRSITMAVLEVVQSELGAVEIAHDLLWSLCRAGRPDSNTRVLGEEIVGMSDQSSSCERYKVYLYVHGLRCVGLCLVERIDKAYQVVDPAVAAKADSGEGDGPGNNTSESRSQPQDKAREEVDLDAPVTVADTSDVACMGISRIWVSSSFRKQGVATTLLDVACKTFVPLKHLPKEMVAFSQPTQSGARLARRWFGREHGWHVYTDCKTTMVLERGEWHSRRATEDVKMTLDVDA